MRAFPVGSFFGGSINRSMDTAPDAIGGGGGGGGVGVGGSVGSGIASGKAATGLPPEPVPMKIQAFESKVGGLRRHEDSWKRTPNTNNSGAIHCKTFHCKLSDDALGFLDQQVNEWLDAHPQYEVKFSTSCVGEFQGKMGREFHMILQVWV